MKFEAFVFDLDGTILNTLPDLVALTNAVLVARGYPQHTTEEVLSYVGGGVKVLLERALPTGTPPEEIADIQVQWMQMYPDYGHKQTKPYPQVAETLTKLRERGCKLGVLSNKFDAAAREVVEAHFPGAFDIVRGEGPDTPRKPDPTGLRAMLAELGVEPSRAAYVGDSGATDMAVAVACGVFPIGVTWGYQSTETLLAHGAQVLIDQPVELLQYAL